MRFNVHHRAFRGCISTDDGAKASVAAAMRAKATGIDSVVAVRRDDTVIQLYRVSAEGKVTRGKAISSVDLAV